MNQSTGSGSKTSTSPAHCFTSAGWSKPGCLWRKWWRRTGRELSFPIDGVTQPTKPVGTHALSFAEGKNPLPQLAPGQYKLMVEAAREVGGRELVSIPFEWPVKQATSLSANGSTELGAIKLELKP